MGVMAGIDLMAKFHSNDDSKNDDKKKGLIGSKTRFKKYLDEIMGLKLEPHQELVYQCRNAMMHSFGYTLKIILRSSTYTQALH